MPDGRFGSNRGQSLRTQDRRRITRLLGGELLWGDQLALGPLNPHTLGVLGFEGRQDYGVIGTVVNLAARLCDEARPGQILLSQRAYTLVENRVQADEVPELTLKGFSRPVPAYSIPQDAYAGIPDS